MDDSCFMFGCAFNRIGRHFISAMDDEQKMTKEDKLNFEKLKPFIQGNVLIRWLTLAQNPALTSLFLLIGIFFLLVWRGYYITGNLFSYEWLIGPFTGFLCLSIAAWHFSKNDQTVVLYATLQFTKLTVGLIFIIAAPIRLSQAAPDALHIFLLGILWIPSIEFLPTIRNNPYPFFWLRLISTGIIVIFWHQTGTWM